MEVLVARDDALRARDVEQQRMLEMYESWLVESREREAALSAKAESLEEEKGRLEEAGRDAQKREEELRCELEARHREVGRGGKEAAAARREVERLVELADGFRRQAELAQAEAAREAAKAQEAAAGMDRAEESLRERGAQLGVAGVKCEALEAELAARQRQIQSLSQLLETEKASWSSRHAALNDELDDFRRRVARVGTELASAEDSSRCWRGKFEASKTDCTALRLRHKEDSRHNKEEMELLQSELQALKQANEVLTESNHDWEQRCSELEDLLVEFQHKIQEGRASADQHQETTAPSQGASLAAQIPFNGSFQELFVDYVKVVNENKLLSSNSDKLEDALENRALELGQLRATMSKARVMYGNAVKKVEALEVDKHTLKLKVVELEEELKEAVCSKDAMEFTAQRLSKQVAALTLQFENSKNNGALLSSSVASDATSVADLVEQNRELMAASEEARRLQADVSERVEFAVMKAKIEADHKIKGLQGALRKAEADCEHMGHQCRLYREALEKGSPARDEGPVERSTKLEHDAGAAQAKSQASRCEELEAENRVLRARLVVSNDRVKELESVCSMAHKKGEQAQARASTEKWDNKIRSLECERDKLQNELQEQQMLLVEHRKKTSAAAASRPQVIQHTQSTGATTHQDLQHSLERESLARQAAEERLSLAEHLLKERNAELSRRRESAGRPEAPEASKSPDGDVLALVTQLQADMKEAAKMFACAQTQQASCDRLRSCLEQADLQAIELKTENMKLRKAIEDKEGQIDELNREVQAPQGTSPAAAGLSLQLHKEVENGRAQVARLKVDKDRYKDLARSNKAALSTVEEKLGQLIKGKDGEMAGLTAALAEAEYNLSALSKDLDRAKDSGAKACADLHTRVEQLDGELRGANLRVRELGEQKQALEEKARGLETQLEAERAKKLQGHSQAVADHELASKTETLRQEKTKAELERIALQSEMHKVQREIVSLRASLSRGQKRPRGEPLSGDEGGPWEEREEIGAGAGDQEPKSANLSAKRDGQEQEEEDATGAQAQTAEGTPDRGPKRPKRRIVWRGRGR